MNGTRLNLTGGAGGNAGAGGSGGSAGGGGGGYAGSGGGGYYGSGGDGTAGQFTGDGGDVRMELYCALGSIPENGLLPDLKGGKRGDGLTEPGDGRGGSGKGRATSNGNVLRNIPRLVPLVRGPPDGSEYNTQNPLLAWSRCMDAVIFPSTPDPVRNYEVALANSSSFASPELVARDIAPQNSTFVPSGLKGGEYFWRVRANYQGGAGPGWSEAGRFLKNGPPRLVAPIPALTLQEDTDRPGALDLNAFFTDDLYPGDIAYDVVYEQDASLVHAAVNGSRLDLFAVRRDWSGSCDFTVRATDRGGISALSNSFTVTVAPVNDPPRFVSLPAVDATEDRPFRLDLAPYIADVDNRPDELGISTDSPNAVVEGHIITLLYTVETGTDRVRLRLSDGQATVSTELEVRVAPVNDPPRARPLPELVTDEDCPLVLDLSPYAADEEDAPGALAWRIAQDPSGPAGASIEGGRLLRLSPAPDASGTCLMVLAVRDSGGRECLANLSVRVLPVNDPPVLKAIPEQAVKVNTSFQLDLRPFVSDVDNALSDLRVTADSRHASVFGLLVTFRYPADETLDREVVAITVSDGRGSARGEVPVALRFPPSFSGGPGVLTVRAGRSATADLSRYAGDREDGPAGLRWSVGGVDQSLLEASVDPAGRLTVRSLGRREAATSFEVAVRDSDGNTANLTVQVLVHAPRPSPPVDRSADYMPPALALVGAAALVGASAAVYLRAGKRAGPRA
jgi:hypothetical protein